MACILFGLETTRYYFGCSQIYISVVIIVSILFKKNVGIVTFFVENINPMLSSLIFFYTFQIILRYAFCTVFCMGLTFQQLTCNMGGILSPYNQQSCGRRGPWAWVWISSPCGLLGSDIPPIPESAVPMMVYNWESSPLC